MCSFLPRFHRELPIALVEVKMKTLLFVSLCFVAVLGAPDSELRLEDDTATNTVDALTSTNEVPEEVSEKPQKQPRDASQGTAADRTKLIHELFTNYNKKVNPDHVKLNFGVALINFRVRELENALDSSVWLRMEWNDDRLKWDPKEYGGTGVIRIPSGDVWTPDVTLYNSADYVHMANCWNANALIYSTGTVLFVPPCKMSSQCDYTLNQFPYGEQTCTFKFGSWTFDGNALDLHFYNEAKAIDTSELHNSSGFEVVSTTAERHVKTYSCCTAPYIDLTFNMTLKRIPGEELIRKH